MLNGQVMRFFISLPYVLSGFIVGDIQNTALLQGFHFLQGYSVVSRRRGYQWSGRT